MSSPLARPHDGPLYGYRAWRVHDGRLFSLRPGSLFPWPEGKALGATCYRNFLLFASHVAPKEGCTCGVYAWRSVPQPATPHPLMSARPLDRPDVAWGVVRLTGKVVAHERGYRAQHARPVAILGDNDDAARRYGLVTLGALEEWEA